MPAISFTGAFNAATLTVPDLYINATPPSAGVIRPASFGLLGIEGVASWGPVNIATTIGSTAQLAQFGPVINRANDLATACAVALQLQQFAGLGSNLVVNRVTDGSDTAATGTLGGSTGLTLTSKYTGTLGNSATGNITTGSGSTSSVPTYRLTLQMPGVPSEVFDNISGGIYSNTVSAGTGATAIPLLTFSAPTGTGGQQATGTASLVTVGTPTVGAGGTGYAAGDTITLGNGVIVKVATVTGGAVATFAAQGTTGTNIGSLTGTPGTAVPTNPVAQVSTSGSGTGATVNLTWGLGPVTMTNPGTLYSGSPTCTVGASGGSGTVTPAVSYWGAMSNAVNNGNSSLRGPSQLMVASYGASTTAPTNPSSVTLAGGTDGAGNVTSAKFVGVDTYPRTGVYAFRGSGISDLFIADFADTTQESTLITFAQSEGILFHANGPAGETASSGQTTEQTNGSNNAFFKRYLGDWVAWNDNTNGVQRSLGPATFGAAQMSTLQPQQSALNKPISNVVSTQRSRTGIPYGTDELAILEATGIDVICNPIPAGPGFGCRLGITTTSNGAANTDNWPRLTSFLARSIAGPGGLGTFIGRTITDQFFQDGYAMLGALLGPMAQAGQNQVIQAYNIQFSRQNNPQSQTAQGVVVAIVLVQYLGIARVFLVNMTSGATVVIPANTNVAAAAAQLAAS